MTHCLTPPVTPSGCNLQGLTNFFQLSEKWCIFAEVHKTQAKQMISKSDTLRMVGNGYIVQLYTCMIPKKQHKRKSHDKRRLLSTH